jgi:ABC-type sugar transport system substrate-binding protein
MKRFKILLGLITSDNDYQREQATQAEATARTLGLDLQIVYAEGDALAQSQQLLDAIQVTQASRPDGIIFDPVSSTGLPHVARAAISAGVAWATIDLKPSYLPELRGFDSSVAFGIGSDQVEVGRIQGRQLARLLPQGGGVLVIQGPSDNITARERLQGLQEAKPGNVSLRILKGRWSKESGHQAVAGYLMLPTARAGDVCAVAAQTDVMALGARRAFEEVTNSLEREKWLALPFLGCDGLPGTGQAWVRAGQLAATIVIPPNAPQAVNVMVAALSKRSRPPEYIVTAPCSYPELSLLEPIRCRPS